MPRAYKLQRTQVQHVVEVSPDVGEVGQPLQVGGNGAEGDEETAEQQDGDGRHWSQEHRHLSGTHVNVE